MSDLNTLIAQRNSLDAQIAAEQLKARAQNLQRIRSLMAESGITAADLAERKARAPSTGKIPPKYRDAHGNTWSGRGFQPVWLRTAIAAGASLESFRIAG